MGVHLCVSIHCIYVHMSVCFRTVTHSLIIGAHISHHHTAVVSLHRKQACDTFVIHIQIINKKSQKPECALTGDHLRQKGNSTLSLVGLKGYSC